MKTLYFCGRNFGLFIAAVLALLWWFAPSAAVGLLDANLVFASWLGKLIGSVIPAAGLAIEGLLGLVQGLAKLTNFVSSYLGGAGPRSEASVRIVVETLVILVEIKAVRWSYNVLYWGWRLVSYPFRPKAEVIRLHRAA